MTARHRSAIPVLMPRSPARSRVQRSRPFEAIFDEAAFAADLDAIATRHRGDPAALRLAVVQRAKQALADGRRQAEVWLTRGRPGPRLRRPPVRPGGRADPRALRARRRGRLRLGPPVHRRAHGGGGHRRLWPRPAGAGLRHRSAVPAALQADRLGRERRRVHALHAVGPRPEGRPRHPHGRRVHPPGQGRHDHPHGGARGPLHLRRPRALRRADRPLRPRGGVGHRLRLRRRQARRARRAPPPGRRLALSGRAQRQGRQGRPARPAHAVLDRQVRLPRARAGRAGAAGRVLQGRVRHLPPRRGLPVVGALPPALPDRPGGGAAVLRRPARDGAAARLHRASRPARRRALHEALLPDRQGRRRPHPHRLLAAGGERGQVAAGAQPLRPAADPPAPPQPRRDRRLHRRPRPHHHRRRRGVRARSGQSDPAVLAGRPATTSPSIPTRCG